ncbi:DUF4212 domain-containing protein [Parerythrobacter aestuarii]|uniref:DUF4212 domain-containing protein n=1 Tax=Parerythrobacter aestuarii TaxID=3020909 RepID=UPI0024DE383F|nr:DUF4212 domain-containing protein [Parerythrobacter aestuarii]
MADTPDNDSNHARAYWRANIRLLLTLMAIWFAVSFGAGILFRPFLDQFMLGGFPLGFWFAQQGSIYVFIVLIFYYSWKMHHLEQAFDLDDDDEEAAAMEGDA